VIVGKVQNALAFACFGAILLVSPSWNLDPINFPKLIFIAVVISWAFAIYGPLDLYKNLKSRHFVELVLFSALIVGIVIATFRGGLSIERNLLGVFGRNAGTLSFALLSISGLLAMAVSSKALISKVFKVLIATWVVILIYNTLQLIGWDPINWNNSLSAKTIGTFGNPNFNSGFLGICSALVSPAIFSRVEKVRIRIFFSSLVILSGLVIYVSESIQGLFVIVAALVLSIASSLLRKLREIRYLRRTNGIIVTIASLTIALLILGKGLIERVGIGESLQTRIAYWAAGKNLILDYPLTGVGFDRFGDYFRNYRSIEFLEKFPTVSTNSSHNLFLDLGASGGILVLLPFVVLNLIAFKHLVRVALNLEIFDAKELGIGLAWLGYFFQGLVSPFSIGIALPGWVLLGCLLSFSKSPQIVNQYKNRVSLRGKQVLSSKKLIQGFVGISFAVAALFPSASADFRFVSGVKRLDVNSMKSIAVSWPQDEYRLLFLINYLASNNLEKEAVDIAKYVVDEINPRSYYAWTIVFNSSENSQERLEARRRLNALERS